MNINNVETNKVNILFNVQNQFSNIEEKSKEPNVAQLNGVTDKLEISEEGKKMHQINNHINNKLYDSDSIHFQVARKIYDKFFKNINK